MWVGSFLVVTRPDPYVPCHLSSGSPRGGSLLVAPRWRRQVRCRVHPGCRVSSPLRRRHCHCHYCQMVASPPSGSDRIGVTVRSIGSLASATRTSPPSAAPPARALEVGARRDDDDDDDVFGGGGASGTDGDGGGEEASADDGGATARPATMRAAPPRGRIAMRIYYLDQVCVIGCHRAS